MPLGEKSSFLTCASGVISPKLQEYFRRKPKKAYLNLPSSYFHSIIITKLYHSSYFYYVDVLFYLFVLPSVAMLSNDTSCLMLLQSIFTF